MTSLRPRVVDTSLLIAALDSKDAHHEEARGRLARPGPVIVPNEVLAETLGVVRSRDRQAARAALDALRALPFVELGHETDLHDALEVRDRDPSLSLVDAVAVSVAWRLGCPLDTFDERQGRVWRARGRHAGKAAGGA